MIFKTVSYNLYMIKPAGWHLPNGNFPVFLILCPTMASHMESLQSVHENNRFLLPCFICLQQLLFRAQLCLILQDEAAFSLIGGKLTSTLALAMSYLCLEQCIRLGATEYLSLYKCAQFPSKVIKAGSLHHLILHQRVPPLKYVLCSKYLVQPN